MIDLKTVVDNYPSCMSSRVRLRNILMDLYPEEKRQINLALNVFESGIEQQIRDESFVDEKRFAAFIRKLNTEYGMHEQEAKEGICLWLQAYGISYAEPKEKEEITRAAVINRPHVEGVQPFSSGVASSNASDYETGIENGGVVIKKFMGFEEDVHTIPDRLNGYPVKAIGERAFYNCKEIRKVIIPEGVTEIRNCAFMNCRSLEEAILPSSMEKLGISAFACCNVLRKINLPDSIKFIGEMAFSVTALERVHLPDKLRELKEETFDSCDKLEYVFLPDTLTYIGERAFNGCFSLQKIEIPSSVSKIDKEAFGFCDLEQVIFYEGLVYIEDKAFLHCLNLHEIKIPRSVKFIGEHVFDLYVACAENEKNIYGDFKYAKKDMTIYCYPGSYGVVYARENNYKFVRAKS